MLKVIPIAAESLGVRSMATFVETTDVKIFIDPGVALGPYRNRLSPHYLEIEALKRSWEKVIKFTKKSDVIVITHYHYDHYNPDQVWMFKDKILLIKDPNTTNHSQNQRGSRFLKLVAPFVKDCKIADGKTFPYGNTTVQISEPVSHGPGKRLGKVIQVAIQVNEKRFLFTSDIQGPCNEEHMQFIRRIEPTFLYIDGPPFYMVGNRFPRFSYSKFLTYLEEIAEMRTLETLIIDHHSLRVQNWKSFLKINKKTNIVSAAEFLGKDETLLEANRKQLYFNHVGIRI